MAQKSQKTFFRKLKRKSLERFTAGVLGLGFVYGCTSENVIEPNQKPIASFSVNPRDGYAPLASCFDGSSSRDADGTISRFIWSFGDGAIDSNSGARVCHVYANPKDSPYSAGLIVEDNRGERSSQALEQIVARDGSPVINIPSLSANEDETQSLDLTGKITSPIYSLENLTITTTSPELNVTRNNNVINYTNKTKDWNSSDNGPTYIDWIVEDPDGRQKTSRVSVNVAPQTDIKGYTEHVLTGERISDIQIVYRTNNTSSNLQGEFDFQVAISNDALTINSTLYYNVNIPLNANGQDIDLGNVQLIQRYTDPITGEDLLSFMKNYMLESRWDDADLPVKVFIDNNPPSQEYREDMRRGVMELWQPVVSQWLPPSRQIVLDEITNSDPTVGIGGNYAANGGSSHRWDNNILFKKGIIEMDPSQVGNVRSTSAAHELGHLFGFLHTPYLNQIMNGINLSNALTPSPFEGLVLATKYKLKKGAVGLYSR